LKPLWYATRRFYAPRLLTIQPDAAEYKPGDPLALFAVNDSDEPWPVTIRATRMRLDGTAISTIEMTLDAPARSVAKSAIDRALVIPDDATREILVITRIRHGPVARVTAERAVWSFAPDRLINYPEPRFDADLSRHGDEHQLTIHARILLRDIILAPDRLDPDATISDNVVTLLPGEWFTFIIRSASDLDRDTLTSRPVFQCANTFGAPS
jgi:beta-mannosidase